MAVTSNEVPFTWASLIKELTNVLGEELRSPEETLEAFAYVLETFYPTFRQTVMYYDLDDDKNFHLVLQRGYPVSMEEFEALLEEDKEFLRPFKTTRRAFFVDDYNKSSATHGNLFNEGCAAHIPIFYRNDLYGWFFLSATEENYRWSEKERKWLPVLGIICGSYIHMTIEVDQATRISVQQAKNEMSNRVLAALNSDLENSNFNNSAQINPKGTNSKAEIRKDYEELINILTKREKEVLKMVAQGFSNVEISEKLFISKHTVRKHLENIFEKIQVNNRTQAALIGELLC